MVNSYFKHKFITNLAHCFAPKPVTLTNRSHCGWQNTASVGFAGENTSGQGSTHAPAVTRDLKGKQYNSVSLACKYHLLKSVLNERNFQSFTLFNTVGSTVVAIISFTSGW